MSQITKVPIDKIKIPSLRITSVFDKEILDELYESIKQSGIRVPLLLLEVNGDLYLIDGLHRLEVAKKLGLKEVPCLIKKGSEDDLLIENLIVNRQRGKSNPAEEAKIIRKLREDYGYSFKDIAKRLGMSPITAKKLYDISFLPEEVLAYVAAGKLSIGKAHLLLNLPDARMQKMAAEDIVKYGYTELQAKELIEYYLSALAEQEAPVEPKVTVIPPKQKILCEVCGNDMSEGATYHWICPNCWENIIYLIKKLEEGKIEVKQSG